MYTCKLRTYKSNTEIEMYITSESLNVTATCIVHGKSSLPLYLILHMHELQIQCLNRVYTCISLLQKTCTSIHTVTRSCEVLVISFAVKCGLGKRQRHSQGIENLHVHASHYMASSTLREGKSLEPRTHYLHVLTGGRKM